MFCFVFFWIHVYSSIRGVLKLVFFFEILFFGTWSGLLASGSSLFWCISLSCWWVMKSGVLRCGVSVVLLCNLSVTVCLKLCFVAFGEVDYFSWLCLVWCYFLLSWPCGLSFPVVKCVIYLVFFCLVLFSLSCLSLCCIGYRLWVSLLWLLVCAYCAVGKYFSCWVFYGLFYLIYKTFLPVIE